MCRVSHVFMHIHEIMTEQAPWKKVLKESVCNEIIISNYVLSVYSEFSTVFHNNEYLSMYAQIELVFFILFPMMHFPESLQNYRDNLECDI